MKFYTNVAQWGNSLLVRCFENGERTTKKVKYEPTLYVPVRKETGWKTLDGKNVSPHPFLSINDAKEFLQSYESQPHLVYGLTLFPYTYISETYTGRIEYDIDHLRIFNIDIEVQCENGFPDAQRAEEEMLSITMKNRATGHITVWGIGDYFTKREDV